MISRRSSGLALGGNGRRKIPDLSLRFVHTLIYPVRLLPNSQQTRSHGEHLYPKILRRWDSTAAQAVQTTDDPTLPAFKLTTLGSNLIDSHKLRQAAFGADYEETEKMSQWPGLVRYLNGTYKAEGWQNLAKCIGAKVSEHSGTIMIHPKDQLAFGFEKKMGHDIQVNKFSLSFELADGRRYESTRYAQRKTLAASTAGIDVLASWNRDQPLWTLNLGNRRPSTSSEASVFDSENVAADPSNSTSQALDEANEKNQLERKDTIDNEDPGENEPLDGSEELVQRGLKETTANKTVAGEDKGVMLDSTPFSIGQKILSAMTKASGPILKSLPSFAKEIGGQGVDDNSTFKQRGFFKSSLAPFAASVRNRLLFDEYEESLKDEAHMELRQKLRSLPINEHRNEVLELINNSQFSIIAGETGCGKTTQVPQIILEDAIIQGKGSDIGIICTQPRQIAAKSIARRVAEERNESLGQTVGYHVKHDFRPPIQGGSITYCTTGVLLQQLQFSPDSILDCTSHIIVDEVHERALQSDFLLAALKSMIRDRLQAGKRAPKVVLMSATIDTDLWAGYLPVPGDDNQLEPCPSMTVPGRTFPVQNHFLDEILVDMQVQSGLAIKDVAKGCSFTREYLEEFKSEDVQEPNMKDETPVPIALVANTIAHIATTTSTGAVLVFLPGLAEIREVQKALQAGDMKVDFNDISKFRIIALHSKIAGGQEDAFEAVPIDCRKIILSTNIAETSITIPDVEYVVDTGKHRDAYYDSDSRVTTLCHRWISKTSSKQRAGRAGRMKAGHYYALFSQKRLNAFETINDPDILHTDLQSVCLAAKQFSSNDSIAHFLSGAFTPPHREDIRSSISALQDLGALTETENLTALGRLLSSLPVEPALGKLMVLGALFRCFDPIVILSAASAVSKSMFLVSYDLDADARKEQKQNHKSFSENTDSDSLALIHAFSTARKIESRHGPYSAPLKKFMNEKSLDEKVYREIFNTAQKMERSLIECGFIPHWERKPWSPQFGHPDLNTMSHSQRLVVAIALLGSGGNFAECDPVPKGSKTRTIMTMWFTARRHYRARVHSSSLVSKSVIPEGKLISFGYMIRHGAEASSYALRQVDQVSPLTVALFGGSLKDMDGMNLIVDDWACLYLSTDLTIWASAAQKIILEFRKALDVILAMGIADITRGKLMIEDPLRTRFVAELANIMQQDHEDGIIAELTVDNLFPKDRRGMRFSEALDLTQDPGNKEVAIELRNVMKDLIRDSLNTKDSRKTLPRPAGYRPGLIQTFGNRTLKFGKRPLPQNKNKG